METLFFLFFTFSQKTPGCLSLMLAKNNNWWFNSSERVLTFSSHSSQESKLSLFPKISNILTKRGKIYLFKHTVPLRRLNCLCKGNIWSYIRPQVPRSRDWYVITTDCQGKLCIFRLIDCWLVVVSGEISHKVALPQKPHPTLLLLLADCHIPPLFGCRIICKHWATTQQVMVKQ